MPPIPPPSHQTRVNSLALAPSVRHHRHRAFPPATQRHNSCSVRRFCEGHLALCLASTMHGSGASIFTVLFTSYNNRCAVQKGLACKVFAWEWRGTRAGSFRRKGPKRAHMRGLCGTLYLSIYLSLNYISIIHSRSFLANFFEFACQT